MLAVTLHLGLNMVILLDQSRIILKVEIIYDDPLINSYDLSSTRPVNPNFHGV
jgi:hypothetical protein